MYRTSSTRLLSSSTGYLLLFYISFFVLNVSACSDITNVVANTIYIGNICSSSAVTTGADSTVNGDIYAVAAITLGANSIVSGQLQAGAAITLGANSFVGTNIHAGADITLGAYSSVTGTATSDTGIITYGVGSSVGLASCADITNIAANIVFNGDICSSSAVTTGADSTVNGNIKAMSSITLGANSLVTGQLEAKAAITLGANSVVNGFVHSGAAITLGAYSLVSGHAVSDIGITSLGLGASVGNPALVKVLGVCTTTIIGLGQIICNNYGTAATVVTLTRNSLF